MSVSSPIDAHLQIGSEVSTLKKKLSDNEKEKEAEIRRFEQRIYELEQIQKSLQGSHFHIND